MLTSSRLAPPRTWSSATSSAAASSPASISRRKRAERAVDPDDERIGVLDGVEKGLRCLAGEVAAGEVDRRERDPERRVRDGLLRRDERRFRVQRVEDRLDQEDVDPALDQRPHLLRVGVPHLVEGDGAVAGVVDAGRERERDVERPDGAGDELAAGLVRGLPCEPGAGERHLGRVVGEAVVGLADPGRGEGVRRRDVGARGEVVAVDAEHDLGPGQVEQVGVAGDVARVVAEALAAVGLLASDLALDQHAPRAVEDRDPVRQQRFEAFARAHGLHCRRCGRTRRGSAPFEPCLRRSVRARVRPCSSLSAADTPRSDVFPPPGSSRVRPCSSASAAGTPRSDAAVLARRAA
jgi:hypothetical protein